MRTHRQLHGVKRAIALLHAGSAAALTWLRAMAQLRLVRSQEMLRRFLGYPQGMQALLWHTGPPAKTNGAESAKAGPGMSVEVPLRSAVAYLWRQVAPTYSASARERDTCPEPTTQHGPPSVNHAETVDTLFLIRGHCPLIVFL